MSDKAKSINDLASERSHALANLNEREIVDWFFGLRLGIDWSGGHTNFDYPFPYYIDGQDPITIQDRQNFMNIMRLMLYVTETKGYDLVHAESLGLELVEDGQALLNVEWSVMEPVNEEITKYVVKYTLKSKDQGLVITSVGSELLEYAPVIIALRAYHQTDGNMKEAYSLVDAITF